jgi:hypothetical protein
MEKFFKLGAVAAARRRAATAAREYAAQVSKDKYPHSHENYEELFPQIVKEYARQLEEKAEKAMEELEQECPYDLDSFYKINPEKFNHETFLAEQTSALSRISANLVSRAADYTRSAAEEFDTQAKKSPPEIKFDSLKSKYAVSFFGDSMSAKQVIYFDDLATAQKTRVVPRTISEIGSDAMTQVARAILIDAKEMAKELEEMKGAKNKKPIVGESALVHRTPSAATKSKTLSADSKPPEAIVPQEGTAAAVSLARKIIFMDV